MISFDVQNFPSCSGLEGNLFSVRKGVDEFSMQKVTKSKIKNFKQKGKQEYLSMLIFKTKRIMGSSG